MAQPGGLHRLIAPRHFYAAAGRALPWLGLATGICFALGLYLALLWAPPDYQQGESYRIMFVHVPSAWLSLFGYVFMAAMSAVAIVWRVKLAETLAVSAAPTGALFTALALITGSLWGKPMWGTWWVWDARLTSELLLLFLYLGYIGLEAAIEDARRAARAAGVLALVGLVNIPIIHFSVEWWSTLHQGPTVTRLDAPAIDPRMLTALLCMTGAFVLYFVTSLLQRARHRLALREQTAPWLREHVHDAR